MLQKMRRNWRPTQKIQAKSSTPSHYPILLIRSIHADSQMRIMSARASHNAAYDCPHHGLGCPPCGRRSAHALRNMRCEEVQCASRVGHGATWLEDILSACRDISNRTCIALIYMRDRGTDGVEPSAAPLQSNHHTTVVPAEEGAGVTAPASSLPRLFSPIHPNTDSCLSSQTYSVADVSSFH
jgi:hypothetical protein